MEQMSRINAVRTFFNKGTAKPVEVSEFMAFWKACSEEERKEFSLGAESKRN